MVRTHLCYGEANVKLMAAYAGLSDSFDGPTHNAISDVAIMRSLPKMTIVVPADAVAVAKLLPQVAAWPVYFRLNRNDVPVIFDDLYAPKIGKAVPLRAGSDVTLICNGMLVSRSLLAADALAGEIVGESDDTLRFTLDGVAQSTFMKNRIGFCILHPDDIAGAKAVVEHVDGTTEQGELPRFFVPDQPRPAVCGDAPPVA